MTVTMSSEGESSKSVLSEANEKSGTDNNTDDSSQDSQDVSEVKPTTENNIENNEDAKDAKSTGDKKEESHIEEKKSEPEDKEKNDKPEDVDSEDREDEKPTAEEPDKTEEKSDKKENDKDDKSADNEKEPDEENSDISEKEGGDSGTEKNKKEVPLLDQPLQKSGKRERKGVQRFEEPVEEKEVAKIEYEGRGTALGDIPRVDASISRFKNDDLKTLHRLLFKVTGKSTMVKKNIRKFNGFDFEKDTDDYNKKLTVAQKLEVKQLKIICEMLDLQKSGNKEELGQRIIDFLMEPKDSGKAVEGGRPKRTAAVKANNRGYSSHDDYSSDEKHSRARRDKGRRPNLKDDTSSDEEFQPNQSDGSEDRPRINNKRKRKSVRKRGSSEEEEESEASIASSDESDDEPKVKRRRSPVKPNSKAKAAATAAVKKTPGKRGRPPASAKKVAPKRGRKPKAAASSEEDESDHKDDDAGSSSEDEPLVKKTKNTAPPTDDEIKNCIKDILEGANLEEITMKTVCQRVYGHYPDFDLTHKKDFIKSTVKSLIFT